MEIIEVQKEINARIKRLEELTADLDNVATCKAAAMAQYDKALAITMLKLTFGRDIELDGVQIDSKIPATLIPKIAAGIVESEKLDLEQASAMYKALITKIETLSATLNAKQSIFRHLSHE